MDGHLSLEGEKIDVMDRECGIFSFDVQPAKLKSSQLKKPK